MVLRGLLAVLLATPVSWAQAEGGGTAKVELLGVVVDEQGAPLEGVAISPMSGVRSACGDRSR